MNSNLPPGVTVGMLPGYHDEDYTKATERWGQPSKVYVDPPCFDCGHDLERHQCVTKYDSDGNDWETYVCPEENSTEGEQQ